LQAKLQERGTRVGIGTLWRFFAKFKALVRAANPRGLDQLWKAATQAIEKFTQRDCRNYFIKAGYKSI